MADPAGMTPRPPAIEIDHGMDSVFSAAFRNGVLEMDIGEDWSGRHHGPHRPQGFQRYLDFTATIAEARKLRDWLNSLPLDDHSAATASPGTGARQDGKADDDR